MKRVLIFIGLKLGETSLIVMLYAVLWGIGYATLYAAGIADGIITRIDYFVVIPMAGIITISYGGGACFGLYYLIKSNWKQAGELANTGRGERCRL